MEGHFAYQQPSNICIWIIFFIVPLLSTPSGPNPGKTRTAHSSCPRTFSVGAAATPAQNLIIITPTGVTMSRFICSKLLVLHYLLRLTQPTMELFLPLPGGVCSGNAVYYVFKSKVIREVYWLQKEHRRDAQSREKVFVLGVLLSQKLERGSQSGGCYVLWGLALSSCGARPFLPPARFAEEACALLTSSKFEACHHAVSPLPYLQNCHYDVCSCSDGRDCLCSAVASYAAACAWRGVHIAWREPSFCGGCPSCPPPPQPSPNALHALRLCPLVLFKALSALLVSETSPGASDKQGLWELFICSHFSLPSSSRTGWWELALP